MQDTLPKKVVLEAKIKIFATFEAVVLRGEISEFLQIGWKLFLSV